MSDQGTNSIVTLACVKEREDQDKIATNRTVEAALHVFKMLMFAFESESVPRDVIIRELEKLRR